MNNSNYVIERYKSDDDGNWLHNWHTPHDSLYNTIYRTSIYNCVGSLPIHQLILLVLFKSILYNNRLSNHKCIDLLSPFHASNFTSNNNGYLPLLLIENEDIIHKRLYHVVTDKQCKLLPKIDNKRNTFAIKLEYKKRVRHSILFPISFVRYANIYEILFIIFYYSINRRIRETNVMMKGCMSYLLSNLPFILRRYQMQR